mgnify:CR=1 FL=1
MPEKVLLNTGPSARGAHRIQLALTCAALYAFQRVVQHPAALGDRGPLVRGSIGHAGLAHHYARLGCVQRGTDPDVFYTPHAAIDLVADSFAPMGNQFRKLNHDAYDAYGRFYAVERHFIEGVECLVDVQVPTPDGPIRFTQRWDLVTKDDAGRLWIHDHKFVAKIEAKTVMRYALSIQFTSMVWLAHHILKERFGGVKLNLIGVGSERTAFQRVTVPPAPDAVRRFPATLAAAERRIAAIEALASPWDAERVYSEQVCMTPYGPCSAMELCRWGQGHLTADGRTL